MERQQGSFVGSWIVWLETVREPPGQYASETFDFFLSKPPKDTQLLLGFVRDMHAAEACRSALLFFCHAVEWKSGAPRNEDGTGEPGRATDLGFDPFRSDLFVAYCKYTNAAWIASVKEVKLVTAAERSSEIKQPLSQMNAAYYYRFQLENARPTSPRDVTSLVHRRPGKPIAHLMSAFAACPLQKVE